MSKHSDIVSRKSPESPSLLQEPYDFSLVLGGPLFQLLRRAYLCGEALELLGRRLLVIVLLAWLPLLVLSVWAGEALGGRINVPFLGLVCGVGVLFVWRRYVALDTSTWYAVPAGEQLQRSLAGLWYGYVSLPIFRFMLLRWYFRLFIWARLLWQVARLELSLVPTHPDRAGGLGFLSYIVYAFMPLLLAQGTLYAGMIANRIFFLGAKLPEFISDLVLLVVVLVIVVLGPLLVFVPQLARAKWTGLREYGVLAQRYVREFDHKWLRGGAAADEPLVGSGDIQSLADLGNSFEVIRTMRLVPFTTETLVLLLVTILAPVLPLTLTMVPLGELLRRLLGVLF